MTVPGPVLEYLSGRLGRAVAEGEAQALSGDASTRRYFRVREGGASRVLALYPEPFLSAESTFLMVGEILAGWGLPVPEVLDVDAARGIVVLADLGDLTLQEALRTVTEAERAAFYREAVDGLVRLQEASARPPRPAPCFELAFDVEKLGGELDFFVRHFVEAHRGCRLSASDRAELAEVFHGLCSEISSWPRVLCHRDYHSRNLMAHAGRLWWIDHQDARMGPATYDLASLLRDSYVDLDEGFVDEVAEGFRSRALPGEPRPAFLRRLELTAVQRNLKALGTFGHQATARDNPVYLPYIPRTLASARRNLARHRELDPLRRALARHLEELE